MSTYRSKLEDDIDISTLLSMREEGMTNKQIAVACDCCVQTIYNYIGKMPKEIRKKAYERRTEQKKEDEKVVVERDDKEVESKKLLKVISTRETLEGYVCKYIVDSEKDTIEIDGVISGILDRETLDVFMNELDEIRNILCKQMK